MNSSIRKLASFLQLDTTQRTIAYYSLFTCLGLDVAVLGPMLPSLAEQTRSSLGQIGLIFIAGAIGYLIGTSITGQIFDHVRGHPILAFAQILTSICVVFIPIVSWFWLLLAIIFLKGIAQGTVNNGSNILLVWTHGRNVAPYMNGLHFSFGIGAFLSPILIAQALLHGLAYKWVFLLLGLIYLILGIRFLFMNGDPQPKQQIAKTNNLYGNAYSLKSLMPFIITTALFLFFYVGSELSYAGWIFTYTTTLNLADPATAAYINSSFWLSFTVGRLLSIPLSTRLNSTKVITSGLAGALLSILFILLVPKSLEVLWIASIGAGFFMAPIFPTGVTLAGESIHLTARITGLIFLGDSLGGMVLPGILGKVIEITSPRSLMVLVFSSLLMTSISFFFILRQRKRKNFSEVK